MINPDKHFMQRCIELSQLSIDNGDASFGSLITKDNKLIAEGVNAANTKVSEHAEITALHNAHPNHGNFRFERVHTLYELRALSYVFFYDTRIQNQSCGICTP